MNYRYGDHWVINGQSIWRNIILLFRHSFQLLLVLKSSLPSLLDSFPFFLSLKILSNSLLLPKNLFIWRKRKAKCGIDPNLIIFCKLFLKKSEYFGFLELGYASFLICLIDSSFIIWKEEGLLSLIGFVILRRIFRKLWE